MECPKLERRSKQKSTLGRAQHEHNDKDRHVYYDLNNLRQGKYKDKEILELPAATRLRNLRFVAFGAT